jgi:hypothetical protein
MSKSMRSIIMAVGLILSLPQFSQAIPAFARKYGFNCNMCHTAYTKLNDFGQRFRNYGYQIPGQEGMEKNVFETAPPLAMRTSFGLIASHRRGENRSGFVLNGLDLLAAGALHKNISFLLIYTPRLDEPAADYTGSNDGSNPSQLGALESVSLVFSNIIKDAVNLRVGRFEAAYKPFSSKRSFYLKQPYEVYTFSTPSNRFQFDDNQMGVEASGQFRSGFRYACGLVNGSGGDPDNSDARDIYFRLAQILGRGEGQNAGQRVGLFGYFGWQPTQPGDTIADPDGLGHGHNDKPFRRLGGDVSINWQTINLHGMFMQGVDDLAIAHDSLATEDYKFTGGFVQLDYATLPNNRLVSSLLYNWVTPPDSDKENQVRAFSALMRYYLGDWTAVNVALHGEFTHRIEGDAEKTRTNHLALLIDFAF